MKYYNDIYWHGMDEISRDITKYIRVDVSSLFNPKERAQDLISFMI
jgi:hypothetical protein